MFNVHDSSLSIAQRVDLLATYSITYIVYQSQTYLFNMQRTLTEYRIKVKNECIKDRDKENVISLTWLVVCKKHNHLVIRFFVDCVHLELVDSIEQHQ